MNIKNLLLSITLAVLITAAFGFVGYLKRYSLWSGYEIEAKDAIAFVLLAIGLTCFLYLKVIGRGKS